MAIRRWMKIGGGIAAGVTTLMAFFALITLNFDFIITDLTGNFSCEGTYENPCMSQFTVRNPTPTIVDIYSKDQVKLGFSPEIEDYALFVPDGRCSATGKCACDLKDGRRFGFEDWRCVDFTNKTKPRKDKVYNFRFNRYSTTEFLLAGIKKNPEDIIKWTFGTQEIELDPVWEGVIERKIIKEEYRFNSKITEWDDGTGNAIIGGQIYADSKGTKIEDAKSLKNCEFCNNIKLVIQEDKKYPLEVIDYNYTVIIVRPEVVLSQVNKNIPLTVYMRVNESDIKSKQNIKSISIGKLGLPITLPFGFNRIVRWGENSTFVSITGSSGDGVCKMYGSGIGWNGAHDAALSTTVDGTSSPVQAIRAVDNAGTQGITRTFLQWDTSSLGDDVIITDLWLGINSSDINDGDNDGTDYVSVYNSYQNQTTLLKEHFNDCGALNSPDNPIQSTTEEIDLTGLSDTYFFNFTLNQTGIDWVNLTGTTYFCLREGHDAEDIPIQTGISVGNTIDFYFSETATAKPTLFVTYINKEYNLTILEPTTESPASKSSGEILIVTYYYSVHGVNQTSNVETTNISIGGTNCVLDATEVCTGTLSCSLYMIETTCNNCSQCNWSTSPVDYTNKACGNDCSGGDYSYPSAPSCTQHILADACGGASSCDGTDTVVDIWLNGTRFKSTDTIGVTMGVMCYGTGDQIKIWYYNGSTWSQEFYDATCAGQGYHNITDTIQITSTSTTQYIRGQVTYGDLNGDDECYTGIFGDNDDLNFTVVSAEKACFNLGSCGACAISDCDTNCSAAGCSKDSVTHETFVADVGWQVNCTVPVGCAGSNNLFLEANYTIDNIIRNDTQTNAVTCPTVDSCTYSGSGDYEPLCSDNCDEGTIDILGNNVLIKGTGTYKGNLTNYANLTVEDSSSCSAWVGF